MVYPWRLSVPVVSCWFHPVSVVSAAVLERCVPLLVCIPRGEHGAVVVASLMCFTAFRVLDLLSECRALKPAAVFHCYMRNVNRFYFCSPPDSVFYFCSPPDSVFYFCCPPDSVFYFCSPPDSVFYFCSAPDFRLLLLLPA